MKTEKKYTSLINKKSNQDLGVRLVDVILALDHEKPNDRSPVDRYYAILKTDLEKALAYYLAYIQSPTE